MWRLVSVLVVLGGVAAAGLAAQQAQQPAKIDVTGVWEIALETPQGTMNSTATYKQEGEKLTGTHVGQLGELPLVGTVKGHEIAYTITIEAQGQQFTLSYKGKVEGDTITGTVDFGGMGSGAWSAKRKK